MEPNVNVWKANLANGVILGLFGIVYNLIIYFFDLTFNKSMGYVYLLITVFLLYYFIKKYRDNYMFGTITYGQSVGSGIVIYIYSTILISIFTYFLYKVIDPGLTDKMLAYVEETIIKQGKIPEEQIDAVLKVQKKLLKPEIAVPISLISSIFFGTIISLIVSIFTRKEGNPLIDSSSN
jgi:hypothetical protein